MADKAPVVAFVTVKPATQSKTVWLNSVVLVLSLIFAVATGADLIEPVEPKYEGYVTAAIAVVNVVLRIFATKGPVTLR